MDAATFQNPFSLARKPFAYATSISLASTVCNVTVVGVPDDAQDWELVFVAYPA
jgi:hypothetical protein